MRPKEQVFSREESKDIDKFKDNAATKHGYIVIRIDCDYANSKKTRDEYIIENIWASELCNIFDLNTVDIKECCVNAEKSMLACVIELWNNGHEAIHLIAEDLHISTDVVRCLLYKASDLSLINDNIDDIKKKNLQYRDIKFGKPRAKKVKCDQTNEIFNSYLEANKKYHANLYSYFHLKSKYSGTLPDGTKLTWTKLN